MTEREDYRAGLPAAMVANLFRGKSQKAVEPLDFFRASEPKRPQTTEEQLEIVRMLNAAFGGVEVSKSEERDG